MKKIIKFFIKLYNWIINSINWKVYIINNKLHTKQCTQLSLEQLNVEYKDKKLITISPSGYYGFYTIGICIYIREHYDISNCIFSGISSGAWNCFFMAVKEDKNIQKIKDIITKDYRNKYIPEIVEDLKQQVLIKFTKDDFDMSRIYIGTTVGLGKTHIYNNFETLEDMLECCISSSNVPFVTGTIFDTYKNSSVYDGIFSKNPYLELNTNKILEIHHNMWGQNSKLDFVLFKKFTFEKLFENGYNDTEKYGKEVLDKIFLV